MLQETPEIQLQVETPVVVGVNAVNAVNVNAVGGNGSLRSHVVGVFGDGVKVNAKEVLPPDPGQPPRAH